MIGKGDKVWAVLDAIVWKDLFELTFEHLNESGMSLGGISGKNEWFRQREQVLKSPQASQAWCSVKKQAG